METFEVPWCLDSQQVLASVVVGKETILGAFRGDLEHMEDLEASCQAANVAAEAVLRKDSR